jgi:hypothetical protein
VVTMRLSRSKRSLMMSSGVDHQVYQHATWDTITTTTTTTATINRDVLPTKSRNQTRNAVPKRKLHHHLPSSPFPNRRLGNIPPPIEQKDIASHAPKPSTKPEVLLPASSSSGTYPALECDSIAQDAALRASKSFRQASQWHMQPSHPRHASHRPYARVTKPGRKVWKGAVGQTG